MNEPSIPEPIGTETLVAEVTDEFLERLRCGDRPDIDDYALRYPQIASVLRHVLPALAVIGSSASSRSAIFSESTADIRPEAPLGDYRIVREIGRGGMGIVYQAVQMSLGREVALKVLPFAAAMDPKQLQRFKNEAQAAAHLHHTNIVPVYGVGCERGVHYYAMQYIEGHTVATVIAELRRLAGRPTETPGDPAGPAVELTRELATGRWAPRCRSQKESPTSVLANRPDGPSSWVLDVSPTDATTSVVSSTDDSTRDPAYFRTVANLGVQAARALEHAHSLGVLHRDIKPANLIVDLRGNLWITDFGLARLQDGIDLTVTSDLVGTLRYMSPEQALAQRVGVDHRTDVYSLGMTLYELATLEPAFDGHDRRELLRQIDFEEPVRPRLRNKAVPSDLETIVLKAIEKNPIERYATAQELADELQRFLDDKPIRAKRPTLLERSRKWARRHKPVVTTGVAGMLVALAILAGGLGWIMRDRAARAELTDREVDRALVEAVAFQDQAKWLEALEAAKRAQGFLAVGASEGLRQRVSELRNDLEMVLRLEEIWLPRAVHGAQGVDDKKWADAAYAEAFRKYGIDVEAMEPSEAAQRIRARPIRLELALALDTWADRRRLSRASADESWKRLLVVARAADPHEWRDPVRAAVLHHDTQTLNQLAAAARIDDLPIQTLILLVSTEGLLDPDRARSLLLRAQREHPDNFHLNFQLAGYLQSAPASSPAQNLDAVIRFYTAARSVRPRNAETCVDLGDALRRRGELDEAIALYRKAIALEPDYVLAHFTLSNALQAQGKQDEAIAALREGVQSRPKKPVDLNDLAWFLATCKRPEFRDPHRAVELAKRAVELVSRNGEYWNTLGVAHYRAGNWNGATAALEKSISLRQSADSFDWFFLAMARWQLGERAAARHWYDQAVHWMDKNQPNDEELRRFRVEAAKLLGIGDPIRLKKAKEARQGTRSGFSSAK
jgi:serine/threonine protein kinase/Tfp pilus assembly protein PilF